MAKVLFYDIETAPNLAYVWGQYDQNVVQQYREWYLMCFAYRWEHQKKTKVVSLTDFELYDEDPEDDREVAQALWNLFDEADIVIAHNGNRFDMRKANARFIVHGLSAPTPVQQIDTLKVARKYFMFNSNKLGDLGQHLKLGKKESTGGFELWVGCMKGEEQAWKRMIKYARQDVNLLMEVYYKLRPFMTTHPNKNLINETEGSCPTCCGTNLMRRGYKRNRTTSYIALQCMDCGSYCRERLKSNEVNPTVV